MIAHITAAKALAAIAKTVMPLFNDRKYKVIEVMLRLSLEGRDKQFVKIVFYQPLGYMFVAYAHADHPTSIVEKFEITAHHDSTWAYDGFGFLNYKFGEVDEIDIVHSKVVDITAIDIDEQSRTFVYVKKKD